MITIIIIIIMMMMMKMMMMINPSYNTELIKTKKTLKNI